MKNFGRMLLLATVLALPLGGCTNSVQVPFGKVMESEAYDATVYGLIKGRHYSQIGVWTDPKTGCEYFTGEVNDGIFMTPRMSKGVAVCHDDKSSDYETYQRLKKQYEGK